MQSQEARGLVTIALPHKSQYVNCPDTRVSRRARDSRMGSTRAVNISRERSCRGQSLGVASYCRIEAHENPRLGHAGLCRVCRLWQPRSTRLPLSAACSSLGCVPSDALFASGRRLPRRLGGQHPAVYPSRIPGDRLVGGGLALARGGSKLCSIRPLRIGCGWR